MKVHAMIAGLLATVAACSPAPAPTYQAPARAAAMRGPVALSATEEQSIKAQAEAWVDCATDKAKSMDDGRSDAGTIAQAVRSACRSLYTPRDNEDLGFATQIVLQTRANDPEQLKQQITPAWANCTDPYLTVEYIKKYSVNIVATTAARECKQHFQGKRGRDLYILTIVAKQRLKDSTRGPIVGRPQPLPPTDKKL